MREYVIIDCNKSLLQHDILNQLFFPIIHSNVFKFSNNTRVYGLIGVRLSIQLFRFSSMECELWHALFNSHI